MTPERFQMLCELLGGLGLQATFLASQEAANLRASDEEQPEPTRVTRDDFLTFAREQGYSDARAFRAWRCVSENELRPPDGGERFPPIRYVGLTPPPEYSHQPDERTLDLNSVYQRLIATELRPHLWGKGNKRRADIRFLAHMVNELARPKEPLPMSDDG